MRFSLLKKHIACCLAIVIGAPAGQVLAAQNPASQSSSQTQIAAPQPDSSPTASSSSAQNAAPTTAEEAQNSSGQQPLNKPLGTAVAPYERPSGVTAARPAGAVIAPAKQRRFHSIFIKVGLLVGGAAAIGAVALLSHASSSQPH